jgi:SAM-dependent methyltransferase
MVDPVAALRNWLRVLRKGGHLVVLVPEEDLYEQGVFPSASNPDHKWTFAIHKQRSWSQKTVNLTTLLSEFSDRAEILKLEKLDSTYRYNLPRFDQTLTPVGECAIEFILRKLRPEEIARKGRLPAG